MSGMSGRAWALLVVVAVTAAIVLAGCKEQSSSASGNGGGDPDKTPVGPTGPGGGDPDPPPDQSVQLPSYWFESDFDSWVGLPWDEIELIQFMPTKPSGMESGTRYVVFYSRTCDHCETMFNEDLAIKPDLAAMVTAVEVPDDKDRLTSPEGWRLPRTQCEMLSLPLGVNWIMQTPVTLRIEDGIVRCVKEGEHRGCMELE